MRKYVLPFATGVALLLAACLSAPGEPTASTGSALSCPASERAFNGACRKICASNADCSAPNTCMVVSGGSSLCLDYANCGWLGSDTECAGVSFGSYGGYTTVGPYFTPSYDPYVTPYGGGSYGYGSGPFACGGNAAWQTQAPLAGSDPRCGEAHAVQRCQRVNDTCSLVSATTHDVADQ